MTAYGAWAGRVQRESAVSPSAERRWRRHGPVPLAEGRDTLPSRGWSVSWRHDRDTGQPLFSLRATIDMPGQENVVEARRGLEKIAAEQNIDIELRAAAR